MRILIINPNTTSSMTEKIGAAASKVASNGTEIVAVNPAMGPASIEGFYDEAFAVPGLLAELAKGEQQGIDAAILACFDDTGLDAARTLATVPVLGICEAGMHVATMLSNRFSVVTTLPRSIPALEHLAQRYGVTHRCTIRASNVPVLALEDPASDASKKIKTEIQRTIDQDGAECVLLGCAGMADLAAALTDEFGLPVLDGVACATRLAEALVGLGLRTSKVGGYATPLEKTYTGAMAPFAPGNING